tara:strand:+ start:461 stop:898 length:438 start_codon:yes stop_codon:yes gene_type:complete
MRTVETIVYTINDHPNKDLCFEWMRNYRHDLNDHNHEDVIASLNALEKVVGGNMDYRIGHNPDSNDFISWIGYDKDALKKLEACDLPLTGTWSDHVVIVGLRKHDITEMVCGSLRRSWDWSYSDEGLAELCEGNEFEFTADGKPF